MRLVRARATRLGGAYMAQRPHTSGTEMGALWDPQHVRLEKRETHLPERVLDIRFGQPPFAGQLFRGVRQTPGEVLKHPRILRCQSPYS